MKYEYKPEGVCPIKFIFDIEDDIILDFYALGGCSGNLQGISVLIKNKRIDEVIMKLKNIRCGSKATSCPDQISIALKAYKEK